MRKLELKDIVGYLPYDLHIMRRAWDEEEEVEVFEEVTSDWIIKYITFDYLIHERCKPILRPMSDLTKPLEDGTMPIVELAKIAFKKIDFVAWVEEGDCFVGTNNKSHSFLFSWSNSQESFSVMTLFYSYSKWRGNRDVFCPNQLQLFDYLNSHLFDYRGLIEEGLAIDINTLNQ